MANKFNHTWFVTFEVTRGVKPTGVRSTRATKTFSDERAAKEFALKQFEAGLSVSAGTISSYVPRRAIASAKILGWFQES
jgi:hypothetical protein